ncbi:dethiobiotin synthase [Merismopedia glauca]|uniref:ATP-dependent dethiobiotin synthetase BioD n=1 Tax=Merismopedia glauca CCAP 1448/3 TaxID=1296344 RepID=A0A2T1C5K5_9CYAN|nr:dethiobiotin synthase [Merismopedia glauca]PSB03549.1 ATP-dependent dethiobiotin synthetase BioD [Merismopedia glauca CCAP 1448/3]
MNIMLIAGTDTEVGKTVLTTSLAAYWQAYRSLDTLGVMKLIQSGIGDRELYTQLFSLNQSPESINPLHFPDPIAPPLAAANLGQEVDLGKVWQSSISLSAQKDYVLVEGIGGLGTPVTWELTVADLARDWALPTVLVVPVKLGAIAQAVANVALARQYGVSLKGIVLNCIRPTTNEDISNLAPANLIASLTNIPVLGVMPYLSDPQDLVKLAEVASDLDIEILLPHPIKTLTLVK